MRTNFIKACLCLTIFTGLAASAQATPIDMHRAISGADRPFTTLKDNLPTEWDLWLEPRITGPTVTDRGWHFPERGLGNIYNATQSQLLGIGTRRRMVEWDLTGIWLIWDMLAWVPVPHVLYLEIVEQGGKFVDPWIYINSLRPEISGFYIPRGDDESSGIQLIPEPTSGALILCGCLMLMSRNTRRRDEVGRA